MNYHDDVTILVNSCDKYEDAWEPFFKLLSIYWPECKNYKIVLHTENKKFYCDFLDIKTICTGNTLSWTERLKLALNEVETDYVFLFLEDFFLYDNVDNALFEKMANAFIKDTNLGVLWFPHYFALMPNKNNSHIYNSFFLELNKHYVSRVNVTISLWRKKYLLKMLFVDGTAWYFESCARNMSILLNPIGKPVTAKPEYGKIFPVDQELYGLTKGKWLPNNVDLFSKNHIDINFNHLGFIDVGTTYTEFNSSKDKIKTRNTVQRYLWYLKRNFKFIKRTLHIGPAFYRYCRQIDKKYK